MTKVNPSNGNETKSDIWDMFKSNYQSIINQYQFTFFTKYWNFSVAFTIVIFQFHCKIEHKQLKSNQIKQDMCKCDSMFPNLESSTIFTWLLKFISWSGLSQRRIITVPEGK